MSVAEKLIWTRREWLAEATAWIRRELGDRGITIVGELEQPHVRWWSTVLRIPTDQGDLYLKAVSPQYRFEIPLTALLARLSPARLPELLAVAEERGWMVMRDAGMRLREVMQSVEDVRRWEELLPRYAELQIALADRGDELLRLGVPDARLMELPRLLAEALDDRRALVGEREEALTIDEYERLRAMQPEFAEMCRELARYGIPETIQHDDFHDGNVFVRDADYVFFDWGDSCVSHPFHTMVVALRALAWKLRPELEPGGPELMRLRDAYLDPWSSYGSPAELRGAFALAYRTGTVARALAWRRYVLSRDPEESDPEDADSVPYGLRLFLADGPIGSWA